MAPSVSTIFITGASRGLGFEFAKQYAADGWNVIACCRNPEKASALQNLIKTFPSVCMKKLDVTDDDNIRTLAENLKGKAIDLLINCAGILSGVHSHITSEHEHISKGSDDETQIIGTIDSTAWMRILRTNTVAPIMISQAFLSNLSLPEKSKLIMISSQMGSIQHEYGSHFIAYRTSKAALNAAMKSLAIGLSKDIIVVSLSPGWVQTDMGGKQADLTPEQSVSSMRRTIISLKPENSGQFLNYDGQLIPW